MADKRFAALLGAFGYFFRFAPARLTLNFLLMLLQSLTSGIGLLFILPLLQLIGFGSGPGVGSGLAQTLGGFLHAIHVPLTLKSILICYVAIVSAIAFIQYVQSVLSVRILQGYTISLRDRLLRAILHAEWQFIMQRKTSQFIHTLTGQVQAVSFISQQMLQMTGQVLLVLMYTVLAFMLSPSMTLLALFFALSFLALLLPLHKWLLASGRTQLSGYQGIFQMISEQLACLKMIKSYSCEDRYADKVLATSKELEQQQVTITRITALTQLVYMIGAAVVFGILFYVAKERFHMELAPLLLFLFALARLLPQVASVQKTFQQILHRLPSFDDLMELLEGCRQAAEKTKNSRPVPFISEIRLEDVSYWYREGQPVMERLNAVIMHNEIVTVQGPSGVGKTTLVDMIAGLLIPRSGRIYCDGMELTPEMLAAWRTGIAYVTQEVFLFHDTIRHNLQWIQPGATEADLWQALQDAAALDFVEGLPQKLDTVIGDRGIRLSGGERQRIVLARALLARPKLLILDEATCALDKQNERKIQEALQRLKGKLTVIVISHGQAFSEVADRVIELASVTG